MKKSKLGSRIVSWFRNVRLGYKLAIVYALSGFLPVVAVLSVTYVQMKQILLQNERDSMESYLYQALASMENKLAIYTNLNNYICYNQTISQVIGYQYDSVYEMYNQLVTILDPMLASLKYFHNDVGKVTIYVDKDMIKHGDTLAPISEIIDTDWYRSVTDSGEMQWFVNKNEEIVFGVSPMSMLKRYGLDGILYIGVEYDSMFETFKQTLQNNYGIVVFDEKGNAVYEKAFFDKKYREYELNAAQLLDQKKNQENEYTILSETSSVTGWTACLYKPNSLIVWSATPITRIAIIAVFVMTLMSVIAMMILTSFVTKRIRRLRSGMKEVEQGNFEVNITSDSRDEIGDLVNGFDSMLLQLNTLIKEVYEGRIKEKEYEMRALQAQINPHFLYNTLETIRGQALIDDNEEIAKMVEALSAFFRYSISRKGNLVTLRDELANIENYMLIQRYRFNNRFSMEVLIDEEDEEAFDFLIPRLIIQPVVENAIFHGLEEKLEGGKVTIDIIVTDKNLILMISDNGKGMDVDTLKELNARIQSNNVELDDREERNQRNTGIALPNIHKRIQLLFGEEYGVNVYSTAGQGTDVEITIPANYKTDREKDHEERIAEN